MKITVPEDCGNSPRNLLVSQFSVDWAAGNREALRALFAEDARWELIGHESTDLEPALAFPQDVREVEVFTAINHGRASSCNGFMVTDEGRIDFCHLFQFSSVTKTAKIVHIRTYLVAD